MSSLLIRLDSVGEIGNVHAEPGGHQVEG